MMHIERFRIKLSNRFLCFRRNLSSQSTYESPWIKFPRQEEGNIYVDNWSLVADGITPKGPVYRNARAELLYTHLSKKAVNNRVEDNSIIFSGSKVNPILEAGDNYSHESFEDLSNRAKEYFSNSKTLFLEDAAVIADEIGRIGVRVISDKASVALIARALLISIPPRETLHLARFDGWKLDPKFNHPENVQAEWDGNHYNFFTTSADPGKGQRPIVAFVGAVPGVDVAIQFVEDRSVIVGANIVAGSAVPISGIIDAIGHAASVIRNGSLVSGFAIKSTVLTKKDKSTLIINGSDAIANKATGDSLLYGHYHNYITDRGVSAFWNGIISDSASSKVQGPVSIVSEGKTVKVLDPYNMTFPITSIVFLEDGTSKKAGTRDEAISKLLKLTDESREKSINAIITEDVKVFTAGNAQDVFSVL